MVDRRPSTVRLCRRRWRASAWPGVRADVSDSPCGDRPRVRGSLGHARRRSWCRGAAGVRPGTAPTFTLTWSAGPLADPGSADRRVLSGRGHARRRRTRRRGRVTEAGPLRVPPRRRLGGGGMARQRRRCAHRLVALGAWPRPEGWTRCSSVPATRPIPVRVATRPSRRRARRCGTRRSPIRPSDGQPAAGVQASSDRGRVSRAPERRGGLARPGGVRPRRLDGGHAPGLALLHLRQRVLHSRGGGPLRHRHRRDRRREATRPPGSPWAATISKEATCASSTRTAE